MAFPTGADVLTYAGAILKVDVADLPPLWTTISTQAAAQGQADILGVMALKGYSGAQLDSWDQSFPFGLTQSLFRLGSMGGGYGDYKAEWFDQFDLCDIKGGGKSGFLVNFGVVFSSNVVVSPDINSPVGGVGFGGIGGGSAVQAAMCAFEAIPYTVQPGPCYRRRGC